MATDTQRTKAALLTLLADNVTGQISAQDVRDFLVTVMESEFLNPGDFFKDVEARYTTTDKTVRGWKQYSQLVDSACSFGNVMVMTASGSWRPAIVNDSTLNGGVMGVAANSYAAAEPQATILRRGIVYNSALSARFSDFIGRPLYLQSALAGSMSVTIGTSAQIVGTIEPDDIGGLTSSKWRFDPEWSVKGV